MNRRARRAQDREAGYSVVEFVLWVPLFFGLLAFALHAGMYLWAEHVAQSAAQAGALTAQDEYVGDRAHWYDDARQAALGQCRQLAPDLLQDPAAAPSQSGTTVTVTVTAHVPEILFPFLTTVSASASGPVETWTTP